VFEGGKYLLPTFFFFDGRSPLYSTRFNKTPLHKIRWRYILSRLLGVLMILGGCVYLCGMLCKVYLFA